MTSVVELDYGPPTESMVGDIRLSLVNQRPNTASTRVEGQKSRIFFLDVVVVVVEGSQQVIQSTAANIRAKLYSGQFDHPSIIFIIFIHFKYSIDVILLDT